MKVILPVRYLTILLPLCLVASIGFATIEVYEFDSAQQEEDFGILVQELRCPKCQNQNIADSNAGLAKDIKDRAYKLLLEGKSKREITNYMVERYGDFITYRPPVTKNTWLLWFGPFVLLVMVVTVLILKKRSDPQPEESAHITDAQKQRVDALLKQYDQDNGLESTAKVESKVIGEGGSGEQSGKQNNKQVGKK